MCETDVHAETAGDISVCIIIISWVCVLAHFQATQGLEACCQSDIYEYTANLNFAEVREPYQS